MRNNFNLIVIVNDYIFNIIFSFKWSLLKSLIIKDIENSICVCCLLGFCFV